MQQKEEGTRPTHDALKSYEQGLEYVRKTQANKPRIDLTGRPHSQSIEWLQPNRGDTQPLHIGKSGDRYSTLSGVCWLDRRHLITNHRCGLRVAVLDVEAPSAPIWDEALPVLTDDIAINHRNDGDWDVITSGCWSYASVGFSMHFDANAKSVSAKDWSTVDHIAKDFAHGAAYGRRGQAILTYSTGKDPRISIGSEVSRLPRPWGVRKVIYDQGRFRHLAVAVNATPKKEAYGGVQTSIWALSWFRRKWKPVALYDGVHSDSLAVRKSTLWLPDQVNDRVLAIDARSFNVVGIVTGGSIDFPHGTAINDEGRIAISNYGSSSVELFNTDEILNELTSRKNR